MKTHLTIVVGHFYNISYMFLIYIPQNIDQICLAIFGMLCGNIEKLELSKIPLHMGV